MEGPRSKLQIPGEGPRFKLQIPRKGPKFKFQEKDQGSHSKIQVRFIICKGDEWGRYDLEQRTVAFARRVMSFAKKLPSTVVNLEIRGQLIRASGSVGANYIEANESLGRKDFFMKMRTCKRESKECRYWLSLVDCPSEAESERLLLIDESTQLVKIFASIVSKA